MSAPDPWRGLRGVQAATLVLEAIAVLLGLLVVTKFGGATTAVGAGLVLALALAMIVAAGLQRRRWGLGLALALQVPMVACWLVAPALGVLGAVFTLVWVGLLAMRREVARRMARGELPTQRG